MVLKFAVKRHRTDIEIHVRLKWKQCGMYLRNDLSRLLSVKNVEVVYETMPSNPGKIGVFLKRASKSEMTFTVSYYIEKALLSSDIFHF